MLRNGIDETKTGSHSTDMIRDNDKPIICRKHCRLKGGNVDNVLASRSTCIPSALGTASRAQNAPTAIPIWNRLQTHTPQLHPWQLSMATIDEAHFCRFCPATNHPTIECPAIRPQLCATLINPHQASLPSLLKRMHCIQPSRYRTTLRAVRR